MVSRKAEERRAFQLAVLSTGQEIEAGGREALPVPLAELETVDRESPLVSRYFGGGLTAEVFKLDIGGRAYTLKKKRREILVQNTDGQTSFLNEVQRRRDFEALKARDPEGYAGIVDTVYASLKHGVILSPWIEGEEIAFYTREVLESIFFTLIQMEMGGIFECDPTSGNLLLCPDGRVLMYDFGYAYPFDPVSEFNSDGIESPVFHAAERFETRAFMMHLLDIEMEVGRAYALALYRVEKEVALKHYRRKLAWLHEKGAPEHVLSFVSRFISLWEEGLRDNGALDRLFTLECFRSCLLDVHDDISGRSCNPDTILKARHVIDAADRHYAFIRENGGFFWGDESLSREDLLVRYRTLEEEAKALQLADLGGYGLWKARRIESLSHYRN